MKTKTTTVYITADGKEFIDSDEAHHHEMSLNNIKYFFIRYNPDVTEGRGLQSAGFIAVNAKQSHRMFAEHAAYELFGSNIEFVQGVFGSNAIMNNWKIIGESQSEPPETNNIIARVEERFVNPKIWGEGIHHHPVNQ